jgi:hypothetical protein
MLWLRAVGLSFTAAALISCAGTDLDDIGSDGTSSVASGAGSGSGGTQTGTATAGSETGGTAGGDGDGDADTGDGDTGIGCTPYGDPDAGDCCENEDPMMVGGIDGRFCSPRCDMGTCPDSPVGFPACRLGPDVNSPENCVLLCVDYQNSTDCPAGATCKDTGQPNSGICSYP